MVVVRLATNTSSSVGALSSNGCSDGKNDSGNPHFDMLYGYVVATVVVPRMCKQRTIPVKCFVR